MAKHPKSGEHHSHESKEDDGVIEIPVGKAMSSVRNNPWIIASIVLAVALIVVLVLMFRGGVGGGATVSADEAGKSILTYLDANPSLKGQVSLVKTEQEGPMYKVTVSYQGQEIPLYATLDGKYMVSNVVALNSTQDASGSDSPAATPSTQDIPKTDKPVVELFVMSYCPYGTQIEKGIIPVTQLLGDKIDFKLKFVYYAMHGKKEMDENTIQYCIQKEQPDKFQNYLACFLNQSNTEDCQTKLKVDKAKLKSCIDKADKEFKITESFNDQASWLSGQFPLYNVDAEDNKKYNVAGSPTFIVNGVDAQSGRDSGSLLKTICGAFTTPPAECEQTLSTASPSPGFGYTTTGDAGAAAYCGP